eukprot:9168244-Pyramimonas_sp.AAC.1
MASLGQGLINWWAETQAAVSVRLTEKCNNISDQMKAACPDRSTLNSPMILAVGELQKTVLEGK